MRENDYQARLIEKIYDMFGRECLVLKNDSGYLQGVPDLIVLSGPKWGVLEVKASGKAPYQPNQEYYLELLGDWSFSATIYPENERAVLRDLRTALQSRRPTRIS